MTVEIDGANNIVKTNTISEVTSANGVTVDGLNIKDSKLVTADSVIQTNITDQSINEAKMQISNAPVNGYMLTSQSGASGGMTWAEAGGGTHVLLGSTNVTSNVSNVTFQSLFSDTYTNYYLTGRGLTKSTASHVQLRFLNGGTTDSGTNYDDVIGVGMRSRSSTTWSNRHNSANQISFMESATVTTGTFTMWIDTSFRGTSTHNYVNLHGIESHWLDDSNGFVTTTFGGVYLPNTNVDGITFITSSGTIDSGRFSLYGVKHT